MKVTMLTLGFLLLVAGYTNARSVPQQEKASTRTFGNFVPHAKNNFKIIDESNYKGNNNLNGNGNPIEHGLAFFAEEIRIRFDDIKITSSHTSKHNGVTHVYVQQNLDGIPVANGVANINVLKGGRIHSIGNSFYNGPRPNSNNLVPRNSAIDAVEGLARLLKIQGQGQLNLQQVPVASADATRQQKTVITGVTFALADVPAELNYLQTADGVLKLVWKIQVDMKDNYYEACVDADSNEVISLVDFVSDATYNVLPFGLNDPSSGPRRKVTDPEDLTASRFGWHSAGYFDNHTVTIGNNVIAQENRDANFEYYNDYRPAANGGGNYLIFDYPLDLGQEPGVSMEASITQLFYMNNIIHDVFYRYGFTEDAGNFQENNFGLGGRGSDAVIANALDGAGYNNANMRTLPDGFNGRMRMYLWNESTPDRDGVFDTGIVIHEYMHGISIRLTGGANVTWCLPDEESGGMGEGWGDIFAVIFQTNKTTTRDAVFEMGTYVTPDNSGIRKFPYSTDMETNPSLYSYILKPDYVPSVHRKGKNYILKNWSQNWTQSPGEVWAVMLYEVYWNLVEKHGFQDDWYQTDAAEVSGGLGGNVIFAQLLIDGMKLQPCEPTFIQARDAIIEADKINNNSENWKEIWTGFAKRGLGKDAESPGIDGFEIPDAPKAGVASKTANIAFLFISFILILQ